MASLALDHDTRTTSNRPARGSNGLIDARAVSAEIEKLTKSHTSLQWFEPTGEPDAPYDLYKDCI